MKDMDLTKLRKAIQAAAEIAPLEEVRMRLHSDKFRDPNEAVAVAYRLSVDIENITFVLVDSADHEFARYVNGSTLVLPPVAVSGVTRAADHTKAHAYTPDTDDDK